MKCFMRVRLRELNHYALTVALPSAKIIFFFQHRINDPLRINSSGEIEIQISSNSFRTFESFGQFKGIRRHLSDFLGMQAHIYFLPSGTCVIRRNLKKRSGYPPISAKRNPGPGKRFHRIIVSFTNFPNLILYLLLFFFKHGSSAGNSSHVIFSIIIGRIRSL